MTTHQGLLQRQVGIAAGLFTTAALVDAELARLVRYITLGSFTTHRRARVQDSYSYDPEEKISIHAGNLPNQGLFDFLSRDLWQAQSFRELGCQLRISLAPLQAGDMEKMVDACMQGGRPGQIDELEIYAAGQNFLAESEKSPHVLCCDPKALNTVMEVASRFPGKKALKIALGMTTDELATVVTLAIHHGFNTIVTGDSMPSSSHQDDTETGYQSGANLFVPGALQVRALRQLINEHRCNATAKPKIIGCGGIMHGLDAKVYINAGADAGVQVATYFKEGGCPALKQLVEELECQC